MSTTSQIRFKIEDPIATLNSNNISYEFTGQKLKHPFEMKTIEEVNEWTDKRGKKITRVIKGQVYTHSVINSDIKEEDAVIQLKHDGSCGYMCFDEESRQFTVYARFDVHIDPKTGTWKDVIGKDWIACEPEPEISKDSDSHKKYHWPHFRPCSEDPKAYKWFIEGFEKFKDTKLLEKINRSFTFELMGNKVQRCESDLIPNHNAVIIPHGLVTVNIPVEMRTYEGFKRFFELYDKVEGVIIHCKDSVYKVRRDMFEDSQGVRLKWPNGLSTLNTNSSYNLSYQVYTVCERCILCKIF